MESANSDDLDEAIEETVWRFECGVRDDDLAERARDLAHALVRAAHSLDGYVPEFLELPDNSDELGALASNEAIRPLVLHALQAELARRYCVDTAQMAARCVELANQPIPGGPRSSRYVSILARSYIAGFHPETVMVAGSILEEELEDAFDRAGIPLPTAAGRSSVYQQIESAHQLGWLTRSARESAKSIWHRRCKVVHEDPALIVNADDTVRATIAVLKELCVVGLTQDEARMAEIRGLDIPSRLLALLEEQLEARRQHRKAMRRGKRE